MLLRSLRPVGSSSTASTLPPHTQGLLSRPAAPGLLHLVGAPNCQRSAAQALRSFATAPEQARVVETVIENSSHHEEPVVADAANFDAAIAAEPAVVEVTTVVEEPPVEAVGAIAAEPAIEPAVAADPAADPAEISSADPSLENFLQHWQAYTEALAAKGYFHDEVLDISSTEIEQYGIIKRATLKLARERPDLLYSLPESKIVALLLQKLPYDERKVLDEQPTSCIRYICGRVTVQLDSKLSHLNSCAAWPTVVGSVLLLCWWRSCTSPSSC